MRRRLLALLHVLRARHQDVQAGPLLGVSRSYALSSTFLLSRPSFIIAFLALRMDSAAVGWTGANDGPRR
jgi:hypothetical protein